MSSSHSVTKWLYFIANSPAVLDSCSLDRLLWIWLYRVWLRCLEAMVLVKPVTVVQWHRQAFGCTGAGGRGQGEGQQLAKFAN